MSAPTQPGVDLRVLGPVELVVDGQSVPIGHVKQRCVLAVLVVEANRVVPTEQLIDRVWGEAPPPKVRNVLSGYVARLRAIVAARLATHRAALVWRSGGYVLDIEPGLIDLWRFRRLTEAARRAAAGDRLALLDRALGLWRGPAFGGAAREWLLTMRDTLDGERLAAEIAYADEALRLGRHDELLERLPGLAAKYPLNEKVAGQLMLALSRSDRDADALSVFAGIRSHLRAELGVEPTPALRELHRQILGRDAGLARSDRPARLGQPATAPKVVPRQLPSAAADFIGRAGYLRRLDGGRSGGRPAVSISAIVGIPGVGKTALAVSWAHRAAASYPDGQLYLNLRGFDPQQPPVPATEALGRLLRGLGIAPTGIPIDLDEQANLYRSLLADKRVLVVLDDAANSEQVRPLLPGSASCRVIVTSRSRLGGLVSREGARVLQLGTLTLAESLALFRQVVGRRRTNAGLGAVAEVGRLCGHLPLALRIAAYYLLSRPDLPVADLVARLAAEHHRLDALTTDDETAPIREAFSLSYDELDAATARSFRLLGLAQGPTISLPAAAALIGAQVHETGMLLDRLCYRHLLETAGPGRYQFHDLLRVYAAERARAEETDATRAEGVRRMLAWYLAAAVAADRLIAPRRYRGPLDAVQPLAPPLPFEGFREALRWCDVEGANLLAAVRQADAGGEPEVAWQLGFALREYFELRKPWSDWLTSYEIGLAAATRVGDRAAEAAMLHGLGTVHYFPRRFEQALAFYRRAHRVAQKAGDAWGEGTALNGIGNVFLETRLLDRAIAYYLRALRCFQEMDLMRDEGVVFNNLAEVHCLLGRYDQALAYAVRSLEIDKQAGSYRIEVFALCHAGDALGAMSRFDEARTYLENALSLATEIEDRHAIAWALQHLGEWWARTGHAHQARQHWQRAIALFDMLGDPQGTDLRARADTLPEG